MTHRRLSDPADRLWTRLVETDEPSENGWIGCWIYTRSLNAGGYGQISTGRRNERRGMLTHRLAYEAIVGEIPDGLVLDHLCRRRACCNPAHLEPVRDQTNLLRGNGWSGRHSRKTHCPSGHPLAGENLSAYHLSKGQRKCLTCHAERQRAYRARRVSSAIEPARDPIVSDQAASA